MTLLNVTLRTGETRVIETTAVVSVMEAIRSAGIDEMMAICGGCCSCATCHIYLAEQDFARLSPASEIEADLLEFSEHLTERSRLSCQITLTEALDGLSVTIAPED